MTTAIEYKHASINSKIFDILDNSRSTVFYGTNGSGKTTMLDFLNEHYTDEGKKVIYFPVDRFFALSEEEVRQSFILAQLMDNNFFTKYEINLKRMNIPNIQGEYIHQGLVQVVHILSTLVLEHENVIVLIDEPERNIQLETKRDLLEDILHFAHVEKLIIATHCPFIISNTANLFDVEEYIEM